MSKESLDIYLFPAIVLQNCILCHAGICNAEKKDFVPTHFHNNTYEFTACFKGKGTCFANDVPTSVKEGDIYVSFPYDHHRIESDTHEYMSYVFVTFIITGGRFVSDFQKAWQDNLALNNRVIQNPKIQTVIEKIIDELQNEDTFYRGEILSALMDELMIYILRSFTLKTSEELSNKPSPDEICRHLSHYIDTHIFEMKSLTEAADALGYNYSYLSALYKQTTGITLSTYYFDKRMQTAGLLLKQEKSSVTKIAEMVGYADIYSFSKAFKMYFKCSPREYIRSIKKHSYSSNK